jgi:hypothetical protein
MNNVYEEKKCSDLRAECIALREKSFQLIAARSTLTHFSHTYENKCSDLRAECNALRDKSFQLIAARSTPTHFSHTYENKCSDLRVECIELRDKSFQLIEAKSIPTHFSHTYTPHKPCSYCSNPYHSENNCPSWGQVSNSSYEQMNTSFSNPGCDSNFNFYNPDWSN